MKKKWFSIKATFKRKPKETYGLKAKNAALKLCVKPDCVQGPNGRLLSSKWFSKAVYLALGNEAAATIISGTIKNSENRGIVGIQADTKKDKRR